MSDEAKATEEVAKTAGKAIDATRELGNFVSRYVSGPLEQATGIIEDKLKYHRWERQVRLMERADQFLKERGLSYPTRPVSLKLAIPILQGASLEDNDDLQDRWVALLVNAADAAAQVEPRRAFVSILEDLAPIDALVLDRIYAVTPGSHPDADLTQGIWTALLPERGLMERPADESTRPSPEIEEAIGNLVRLGLLTSAMAWGGAMVFSCVHQTVLGREFVRACKRDRV
jgi:hypothetical protein